MDLPRISVVTPSYMQGHFLEWTIQSVLGQNYPNLEYIVMDGGSTDSSVRVLERYADRLAHWQSKADRGQADAIARGFERCTGDILAYLNSDDMLAPGTLHTVAETFARHPELDVIYSHRCFVDAQNNITGYWILPPHSSYLMKRFDFIPQETTFWRRRIQNQVGTIDPTYRFAMDYDLFVRFMNAGRVRRINDFFGAFRVHDDSKTQTQLATIGQEEMTRVRTKYRISIGKHDHLMLKAFLAYVKLASFGWSNHQRWTHARNPARRRDFGTLWNGELASAPLAQAG